MKPPKIKPTWSSLVTRSVLFSVLWWILTAGESPSWAIGFPAVLLAVFVSSALLPPVPLTWFELFSFVPFFLLRSLLGGADVAWRACSRLLPIEPGIITYQMHLPSGLPQVCMANVISLLPGTLSAELEGQQLTVHVLDNSKDLIPEFQAVERHLDRIFKSPPKST